jgi:hypothetical protein
MSLLACLGFSGRGGRGPKGDAESRGRARAVGLAASLALGAVFGTLGLGAGGCVVVKPFQREHLAERCMAPGFGDAAELKFRGHWEGSRQGTEGGYGTAGGGCGCN